MGQDGDACDIANVCSQRRIESPASAAATWGHWSAGPLVQPAQKGFRSCQALRLVLLPGERAAGPPAREML